jgi:glyceraldehyde-3-phosphate dehydrogenase (NAD(P))
MKLVGVADIISDVRLRIAKERNFPIYCSVPDFEPNMREAGYEIVGFLEDMVKEVDIVVDCTPAGVPSHNFPLYRDSNIKVMVQGGEKHVLTNRSFSTFGNYASHLGVDMTRIVSCNTTALTRIIATLAQEYGVSDVFVALARRAGDPTRTNRGPINAIAPVLGVSHHGPDLLTVMPQLKDKVYSLAIAGSWTLSHVHMLRVTLDTAPSKEEVVDLFKQTPRILIEPGKHGLFDSAQGRNNLYMIYDVHMESIPIPENIDAIRAMLEMETDVMKCVEKTDKALNIFKKGAYEGTLFGGVVTKEKAEVGT